MEKETTFGAGCFWCIEACFKDIDGVIAVEPGYVGGEEENANYKDVCSGNTDHVEVARIKFDDSKVSFEKLLEMFWFVHDPTQVNRQGNDVGTQYRSAIFANDSEQLNEATKFKQRLEDAKVWDLPIATEIVALDKFYPAEDYHHNYFENNPDNPYCQSVVRPKVEKFKKVFSEILK